ncbi:hypothetical protein QFC20_007211 [Naganishia adeliensis]|uniref:Uncharacterized protein n=1 Tax=Naganishia adeliensis TaxID=92952 RepID=A0ACC2V1Y7_9TREE|nr:hypothetical protein QFC20_007211 [Naganishia adeliensis]
MTIDTSLLAASTTTPSWTTPIDDKELANMSFTTPTHALVAAYAWVVIIGLIPLEWDLCTEDRTSIESFLTGNAASLEIKRDPLIVHKFFENFRRFTRSADPASLSLYHQICGFVDMRFTGAYTAAIMKKRAGGEASRVRADLEKAASWALFCSAREFSCDQTPAERLRQWEAGFKQQANQVAMQPWSKPPKPDSEEWIWIGRDDEGGSGTQSLAESVNSITSQSNVGYGFTGTKGSSVLLVHALDSASAHIRAYKEHLVQQDVASTSFLNSPTAARILSSLVLNPLQMDH